MGIDGRWTRGSDQSEGRVLLTSHRSLTHREMEVIGLLGSGVTSNRELAGQLDVSENTVKYHLKNILGKLHVRDRAQVVAYALQHGLAVQAAAAPVLWSAISEPTSVSKLVAVADDDEPYLALMGELLVEEGGYRVSTCPPGLGGYEHVRQTRPDLVILDLVDGTPDAGWRTLELLTQDPQTRRIPVLLCSAAGDELEGYRGRTDRADVDAIAKPFDIEELLEKVGRLLADGRDGG